VYVIALLFLVVKASVCDSLAIFLCWSKCVV